MPSEVDRYHAGSDWWYPTVKADDGFWVKHSDHLVALEEDRDEVKRLEHSAGTACARMQEAQVHQLEEKARADTAERLLAEAVEAVEQHKQRVAGLRSALERFGKHNPMCGATAETCDCGLREALVLTTPGVAEGFAEANREIDALRHHSEATPVDTTPGESTISADSCGREEGDRPESCRRCGKLRDQLLDYLDGLDSAANPEYEMGWADCREDVWRFFEPTPEATPTEEVDHG